MAAIVAAEVVTEAAEAAGVGGAVVGGVDGGAMTILAGYGPHAGGFGLAPGSFRVHCVCAASNKPDTLKGIRQRLF